MTEKYTCPTCNGVFEADRPKVYCSEKCRYDKNNYDDNGKFIKRDPEIAKMREKIKKEYGYSNLKDPLDFVRETNEKLQAAGLIKQNEIQDMFKFTKEFYMFLGFGTPHSYYHPLPQKIANRVHDFQKRYRNTIRLDSGEVFSPIDDMYGTPDESDTWYDYGRVPTSHLVALCMGRLGVANTVCARPSSDMFDNDFEFVKRNDPSGDPIENKNITNVKNWMDKVRFHKKLSEAIEFTEQTGNGHLVVNRYLNKTEEASDWKKAPPDARPISFETFSNYHMTPINVYQPNKMDYDKNSWKFRTGVHTSAEVNEKRVFVFTLRRYPYQLRDLAIPETAFVSFLCLLNISYYLLKSLAQLGSITIGVQTESLFPTDDEITQYLTYLRAMKANNFFVLGRGATMQVENAAGKIGQGIRDILEYFKEDVSASCVFPKNELFGRVEGGGISGMGALVSKETYINSNVSVKFGNIKRDILWILQNMCHFDGLEDVIPKMNIDLHKTEGQRLAEELQRQQVKQQRIITEQQQLMLPLYKKQLELQSEMADIQMKMAKENPDQLMGISDKDEENLQEKEGATDFDDLRVIKTKKYNQLRYKLLVKEREYIANERILNMLRADTRDLVQIRNREEFAYRKYIDREKRVQD